MISYILDSVHLVCVAFHVSLIDLSQHALSKTFYFCGCIRCNKVLSLRVPYIYYGISTCNFITIETKAK